MPEKAELEILIDPNGEVRITTHGLRGDECLAETRTLEKLLGKILSREKTREFYQTKEGERATVRGR